jgi:hypothetical protein
MSLKHGDVELGELRHVRRHLAEYQELEGATAPPAAHVDVWKLVCPSDPYLPACCQAQVATGLSAVH